MDLIGNALWIGPAVLLSILAVCSFNQPPTNRSSTTFFLFYFGLFLYNVMLLVLWILVIAAINYLKAVTVTIAGDEFTLAPLGAFALIMLANRLANARAF